MTDQFGPITLKWDPKNLEIRTMSVEKTLEPLVLQVSANVQLYQKNYLMNKNSNIENCYR